MILFGRILLLLIIMGLTLVTRKYYVDEEYGIAIIFSLFAGVFCGLFIITFI